MAVLNNVIVKLMNGPQRTACLAKEYTTNKYKWTLAETVAPLTP